MLLVLLTLVSPSHAAEAFGDSIYYFGDLHAHTGFSGDAKSSDLGRGCSTCGAWATEHDQARAMGLDFLALAEHVNGPKSMSAADYLIHVAEVLAQNDEAGGFITIPAGELWLYDNYWRMGHKTLLMWGDDSTLASLTLSDVSPSASGNLIGPSGCDMLWDWADDLESRFGDLFLLPHHPATVMPMPTDWSCHNETYEPAVEIYSRHGNSLEPDSGWDTPFLGTTPEGYVSEAINPASYGLQMGFFGGTDGHDSWPGETCALDTVIINHRYGGGLTGIMLDETETFTRSAIGDAIREHRVYATTGPMVVFSMEWSARGASVGVMGDDPTVILGDALSLVVEMPEDQAAYVVAVTAVGPDGSWTLSDDGAGRWVAEIPGEEAPAYAYVTIELDGDAYYGTGVCVDGGSDAKELVTSSPSYFSYFDDDQDDDGVNATDGDCDDSDASISPLAVETPYDGIDQDCSGDDLVDVDGDGWTLDDGDCDDEDVSVSPEGIEVWYDGIDGDCDGASDYDQDGDGYDAESGGGEDCDDIAASINPFATEVCDELSIDEDCDGLINDDDDLFSGSRAFEDADGDGFGAGTAIIFCTIPEGFVTNDDDCDDANAVIRPGGVELCDEADLDEDCDGVADDADPTIAGQIPWVFDADGDGYGGEVVVMACDAAAGLVRAEGDCDDANALINPSAAEVCDALGIDEDCNGLSDDDDAGATGQSGFYVDADGDGFGAGDVVPLCALADGYSTINTDCDDADSRFHPAAEEADCTDATDYNCDGSTGFVDADGDGFAACKDCDDTRADVNFWATETVGDGVDQDCSGGEECFLDEDLDGYRPDSLTTVSSANADCDEPGEAYSWTPAGDCDDTTEVYGPGAVELDCTDPADYNCDGTTGYADADADGVAACAECDDANAEAYPGAVEVADDGVDQDCDGADLVTVVESPRVEPSSETEGTDEEESFDTGAGDSGATEATYDESIVYDTGMLATIDTGASMVFDTGTTAAKVMDTGEAPPSEPSDSSPSAETGLPPVDDPPPAPETGSVDPADSAGDSAVEESTDSGHDSAGSDSGDESAGVDSADSAGETGGDDSATDSGTVNPGDSADDSGGVDPDDSAADSGDDGSADTPSPDLELTQSGLGAAPPSCSCNAGLAGMWGWPLAGAVWAVWIRRRAAQSPLR